MTRPSDEIAQGECIESRPHQHIMPMRRRRNGGMIRRGFDDLFWNPFHNHIHHYPHQHGARLPTMDFKDKGEKFVLSAELPGVKKENIDLTVSDNFIHIKTNHQEEKIEEGECYVCQERTSSRFHRSFEFPEEINSDEVEATLENGILTISLPKKEEAPKENVKKLKVK